MDTSFSSIGGRRASTQDPRRAVFEPGINAARRLRTCLVCGHRLPVDDGFSLDHTGALRHKNCSKQKLILELGAQAERLHLTSLEVLTRRLKEVRARIVQGLGELSFEQFQTAEPAGYLHLFLCGSDLRVKVAFSRHIQSEAMYVEPLISPGELPVQKRRLLLRFREQALPQTGLTASAPSERVLWEWLLLADWLKLAEEHWNGRNKREIARELLATTRVQFRILNWTGMDVELAARSLRPDPELEHIAREILSAEEIVHSVSVNRNNPAEAV